MNVPIRIPLLVATLLILTPSFLSAQTLEEATQAAQAQAAETIATQEAADAETAAGGPQTTTASANYQFQREGLFGCNLSGSYSMSVGALGAVGGVYVPVNDAAVTLNTGYLVYKECVLDGVIKRQVEQITTGLAKKRIIDAVSGRDGNPQYVQNIRYDTLLENSKAFAQFVQDEEYLSPLCTPVKNNVRNALVRSYYTATQKANRSFACTLKCSEADRQAFLNGDLSKCGGLSGIMELALNPANSELGALITAKDDIQSQIAQFERDLRTEWDWGLGIYARKDNEDRPFTANIVTPSMLIADSLKDALGSGFRQLENASEIDQIVNSLFSGLSTQASTDIRGLAGLTQPLSGRASYLDQMAQESSRGLREGALNAALQILNAARQIETGFLSTKQGVAQTLTTMINQLRSAEKQCWNLIIQKTCATPLSSKNMCTSIPPGPCVIDRETGIEKCPTPFILKVATSTAYSQQVITAQIAPIAEQTANDVKSSERAVQSINQLIEGVTNTTSVTNQRLALEQLDSLVARRALHNQYDLDAAQKQLEDVKSAVQSLVEDTIKAWADSTDVAVGWCNVNNASVIDTWMQRWKKK